MQAKAIFDRNRNLFGAKHGLNKFTYILEESEQEEKKQEAKDENESKKDENEEQEQENEKEQGKKQEQKQDEKEDEKEKKNAKELLESNASSEGTEKQSVDDNKKDANAIPDDTERDHQLVSREDNDTVCSVINAEVPLEIAFKDKVVICASSDDTESVAVKTNGCDNENNLIHFSDSELENEEDQLLHEAEMIM